MPELSVRITLRWFQSLIPEGAKGTCATVWREMEAKCLLHSVLHVKNDDHHVLPAMISVVSIVCGR
jgi:hypothetical protein